MFILTHNSMNITICFYQMYNITLHACLVVIFTIKARHHCHVMSIFYSKALVIMTVEYWLA